MNIENQKKINKYLKINILYKFNILMPVIHVSSEEQFDDILNKKGNRYILVDFFAKWCGPCKKYAPQFEKLSEQYKHIIFLKVDVEDLQDIAEEFEVTAMPTFLMFVTGKRTPVYKPIVGVDPVKIENLLKHVTNKLIAIQEQKMKEKEEQKNKMSPDNQNKQIKTKEENKPIKTREENKPLKTKEENKPLKTKEENKQRPKDQY